MKIGIFVSVSQNSGGIYQYTASMLKALHDWDTDHEFVIVRFQDNLLPLDDFSGSRWSILTLDPQMAKGKNISEHLSGDGLDLICSNIYPEMEKVFKDHRIELVISPRPVNFFFEWGVPYIMAIHDLQHRLQPHFPEVSAGNIWKSREYLFRNGIRYAENILVDSEVGKEDVLNLYGDYISPDQVRSLPFLPFYRPDGKEITEVGRRQVHAKYGLPDNFLFYPAQFWLHKNHSRLIHAVHILRSVHKIDAPLVLAGSNSGGLEGRDVVFNNAMLLAEQLGVKDLVRYIGYVPDNDMPFLYSMAKALTMPTFFGPTNIPFLEAWAFGCPVLASNIRGIRDQVETAGILVDPENAYEMAEGILKLWTDKDLVRAFVAAGYEKINSYTSDDFAQRLYKIIEDVQVRVQTGRPVDHGKIANDADKTPDLNQQGEGLFEKGDLEGALRCFSNALEMEPESAIVHNNIGVLYYTQGDKEKALHHYEKASQIEPKNSNFRKNLADFYYVELGRTKEALEIYLQILTDDPTDIETLLVLGHICVSLGKVDDARVFYNRALEIEPWNLDARERRDELGERQKTGDRGRTTEVKTQWAGLQGIKEIGSPEELYQTAQGFMASERVKEAIGALRVFLAVYPGYALAHNDLGVLYYNEGNKEKALKHYEQASQFEPNNLIFQKNLADFYYFELDRIEEALRIYNKILNENPEDLETLLVMGHICIKLSKIDDAIDFCNRVLEIDSDNANAIEVLSQVRKTQQLGSRQDEKDRHDRKPS